MNRFRYLSNLCNLLESIELRCKFDTVKEKIVNMITINIPDTVIVDKKEQNRFNESELFKMRDDIDIKVNKWKLEFLYYSLSL